MDSVCATETETQSGLIAGHSKKINEASPLPIFRFVISVDLPLDVSSSRFDLEKESLPAKLPFDVCVKKKTCVRLKEKTSCKHPTADKRGRTRTRNGDCLER